MIALLLVGRIRLLCRGFRVEILLRGVGLMVSRSEMREWVGREMWMARMDLGGMGR